MGAGELFLSPRSMTLCFTFYIILFLFWVCWEINKKMQTATDTHRIRKDEPNFRLYTWVFVSVCLRLIKDVQTNIKRKWMKIVLINNLRLTSKLSCCCWSKFAGESIWFCPWFTIGFCCICWLLHNIRIRWKFPVFYVFIFRIIHKMMKAHENKKKKV